MLDPAQSALLNSITARQLPLSFDDYSIFAFATAQYPPGLVYPSFKLAGECGEVLEKVGKILRSDPSALSHYTIALTADQKKDLAKELGDVLWYVNACCVEMGIPFSEVARLNLVKVHARVATGTLSGSGDNREEKDLLP